MREDAEERKWSKVIWADMDRMDKGLEMRFVLDEVAKVEDIVPALEANFGNE